MVTRILAVTLVALGGMQFLSSTVRAQAYVPAKPVGPTPTLSDRLEQFRQDLLSDPGDAEARATDRRQSRQEPKSAQTREPTRAGGRAITVQQRLDQAQRKTPSAQAAPAAPPKVSAAPSQANQSPKVTAPRRLEAQNARKAKPKSGLFSVQTPPERGAPLDSETEDAGTRPAEEVAQPRLAERPTPAPSRVDIDELADGTREPRLARAPARDAPTPARDPSQRDASGVLFTTRSPVLAVQASGPRTVRVGEQAKFVVKIQNSGSTAHNVIVTMNVPEHAEVASAHATAGTVPSAGSDGPHGPLEWKIPRLEGKTGETLNFSLVPRKSEPMDLSVRFTYAPEASQMLVEVQEPKLEMVVAGPDDVQFGETRIYKLTLSNPGNGDARNVVIGLLPVGRGAEGIASHKVGTLRAGQSKTIDVELTARQAGSITIKAQAFADGGLRTEVSEQVTVRRADLRVDVEAPQMTFAGTAGTYRIKVVNSGDAPAGDVQIAAMLPPDAKFIKSSSGGQFNRQQGKVVWNAGNLQPNTEIALELQCSLATAGDNQMQYVATAADELSASTTSSTQVEALADLKIEVRDPQGPIPVGDDTVFEVVVRNRGSAAAQNVDLLVFFSEGLEATSVEGGPHEIAPGQVVFEPIAKIGASETVVVKVHAQADRSGHHVFRAEVACESLGTKLAAEEATYFFGGSPQSTNADSAGAEPQPTPAVARDDEPPTVPE